MRVSCCSTRSRSRICSRDSAVNPVGKTITIDNAAPCEVIGWYHYHPSFFTGGEHAMGIIPVQTLIRHYKV